MKNLLFTLLFNVFILVFISNPCFSQAKVQQGAWSCHQKKINQKNILSNKQTEILPHTFDVQKYQLFLDLYNCYTSPFPKSFSGRVIVSIKVDSALQFIVLDAVNSSIHVDSISAPCTNFNHINDKIYVNFNRTYNPDETLEFTVYYQHLDTADGAVFTGNGIFFTDCEPNRARNWYPCWDKPADKALFEITATTPANVLLGSNGHLQDSVKNANTITYHWVTRDPMSTYLAVISSKVNYLLDIVYWPLLSNPNDSIPIRYYFNEGEDHSPSSSIIKEMTTFFSTKFCEHPFEKNGFATLDEQFIWGGMENQTLTSLCKNCWSEFLTAHEYAHQWFGDMITCATWSDLWLNEGFATYTEALWNEHAHGYQNYKNDILYDANYYLSANPGWAISNPNWTVNTPPLDELFNYAVTYCKGASVLHMLRYVLKDSLFFASMHNWANKPEVKYNSAIIQNFIDVVNQTTGEDYSWFFTQWLLQPNHPQYEFSYDIITNVTETFTVECTLTQTQDLTTTGFFQMPVDIRIYFSDGSDSTIRVLNDQGTQQWSFDFFQMPVSVKFDPDTNIVLKDAVTFVTISEQQDNSLSVKCFPNPAVETSTVLLFAPKNGNISVKIKNLIGQEVGTIFNGNINSGPTQYSFSTTGLSSGVYYVDVTFDNVHSCSRLLIQKSEPTLH